MLLAAGPCLRRSPRPAAAGTWQGLSPGFDSRFGEIASPEPQGWVPTANGSQEERAALMGSGGNEGPSTVTV